MLVNKSSLAMPLFLIRLMTNAFSIELIYAIFLLSGDIKGILPIYGLDNIPNVTLVSMFIISIFILFNYKLFKSFSGESYFLVMLISLLYLFIFISLLYTSSSQYAFLKTVSYSTLIISFILPLMTKNFDTKKFMIIFSFITYALTLCYLNFFLSYLDGSLDIDLQQEQIKLISGMYLTLSYSNGIIILYYFFRKESFNLRFIFAVMGIVFLLLLGGRGPLIFVIIIVLFFYIKQLFLFFTDIKLKRYTVITIFLLLMMTILSLLLFNSTDSTRFNIDLIDRTLKRLEILIGGDSANERMYYIQFALNWIDKSPLFGYGVGSFGYELTGIDQRLYPHNIWIEIWFELGILALVTFLLFEAIVLYIILKLKCSWCIAIYIFLILNTLKSSSLIDIRILMGFFSIFLITKFNTKSTNENT